MHNRFLRAPACGQQMIANTFMTRKGEVGGMQARRTDFSFFNPTPKPISAK